MVDATKRLGAIQQDYGSNPDAWGGQLNVGALERIDEGWGTVAVAVNANVILSADDFIANQSRQFTIILSGAGGFDVTHPAVDKPYWVVNNCAANVTFKPQAGTGAVIRAGGRFFYYTNAAGTIGYVVDEATVNLLMGGKKITGLAAGVDPTDAVNVGQIASYQVAAAASAAAAAASASAASGSASSASTTYTNTLTLYNDFQKRYLGAKAADPTLDNLGAALTAGALYFNTAGNSLRVYNGSNWVVIPSFTLSSQAQAEAGVDNTTIMTPLRTRQAITAVLPSTWIPIASTTIAPGATAVSYTGIAAGFRYFVAVMESTSASATGAFNAAFSSNNGSSYGPAIPVTASVSAGNLVDAVINVYNINSAAPRIIDTVYSNAGTIVRSGGIDTSSVNAVNAVRFTVAVGTFQGGGIQFYGVY